MSSIRSLSHRTARQALFNHKHTLNTIVKQWPRRMVARLSVQQATSNSSTTSSKPEGKLLNACIGPGLQLIEQEYSVAGHVLRLLAPYDVDAVMDMYIAAGIDGDPYWCRVWPSAISLAQQLLRRPELVAGKKVADLGAGLGVAGIAAALAGAAEVVLLDREPMAVQCGLLSAAASGVCNVVGLEAVQTQPGSSSSSSSGSGSGSVPAAAVAVAPSSELLQLSQLYLQQRRQQQQQQGGSVPHVLPTVPPHHLQQQQQQQSSSSTILRGCTFDWNSPTVPERYDVILACDVLYEDTAVDPVAAVVSKLLKSSPGSTLLLADPPNRTAANRQRFVDLLSNTKPMGLVLEESGVYQCDVNQLDPEMTGGVTTQSVDVQFMAFRTAVGKDTVGIKAVVA